MTDRLGKLERLTIRISDRNDQENIFRIRHSVYAEELRQHGTNSTKKLHDSLDDQNTYIVATIDDEIVGFISITPPTVGKYSIDKYFERSEVGNIFSDKLYEIRLLTVVDKYRGRNLSFLLMYAAFRWVESNQGKYIVAIGRRDVLDMYMRAGLKLLGLHVKAGDVEFELMGAPIEDIQSNVENYSTLMSQMKSSVNWKMNIPFYVPSVCFHGGAFFDAIGVQFDALQNRKNIINADVLDAWYPPSPKVISLLNEDLSWMIQTSPPTDCSGFIRVVSESRGISEENILPGAGSSDLIFRALRSWLDSRSKALILDPTYGEYSHVLDKVVRCKVDRFPLLLEEDYQINLDEFEKYTSRNYDIIIIVNPNSPTGQYVPKSEMENLLRKIPTSTRLWIDETYVEYAGKHSSLELFATQSQNVVVCKSMSKIYALSGLRVAYLCGPKNIVDELREITPPWAVSLVGQVAGVMAMKDGDYYEERIKQTILLKEKLVKQLAHLQGWKIIPGIANFILCHLPNCGPTAYELVTRCREKNLFVRDASLMGQNLGKHAVRIAVKDEETNNQIVQILSHIWIH